MPTLLVVPEWCRDSTSQLRCGNARSENGPSCCTCATSWSLIEEPRVQVAQDPLHRRRVQFVVAHVEEVDGHLDVPQLGVIETGDQLEPDRQLHAHRWSPFTASVSSRIAST